MLILAFVSDINFISFLILSGSYFQQ